MPLYVIDFKITCLKIVHEYSQTELKLIKLSTTLTQFQKYTFKLLTLSV